MTTTSAIPGALLHAHAILTVLGDAGIAGADAKTISASTGLGLRMVYRYLASLRELGMVAACGDSGYRLGPAIVSLAQSTSDHFEFFRNAKDYTQRVAAELKESVHISVYDQGMSVTVTSANLHPDDGTRWAAPVGARRPAHASASGKIFLAHIKGALNSYVARPLHAFTPKTICSVKQLQAECLRVKERGWSREVSEFIEGVACVAVPIRSPEGRVLGTFAVSTPADLSGFAADERRVVRSLQTAARELEASLGGRPVYPG